MGTGPRQLVRLTEQAILFDEPVEVGTGFVG